ncbi:MAG TPA: hypothetical protein ENN55_06030, partial [Firmicutes bacterium]|nr:hypothetical protein [Bacillota bacterium]
MLFEFIIITAVFNALLGIIAVIKSRNRLNFSFFMLSMLLAAWNFCVVMYKNYGIEVFDRINFIVVLFIPAAALNFVMALFGKEGGRFLILRNIYLAAAFLGTVFVGSTFFWGQMYQAFHSYACKVMNFLFEAGANILNFAILIKLHRGIKYKMEREKIGYVIIAFSVLLSGGIMDFTESLEWHNLLYMGNISAAAYAFIIFAVIFRLRLFNTGFLFKSFMVYAFFAAIMAGLITAAAEVLLYKTPALYGVIFVICITVLLYAGKIYVFIHGLSRKIGGSGGVEKARAAIETVQKEGAPADEKLKTIMSVLGAEFEMDTAVFIVNGESYIKWWCDNDEHFPDRVNIREPVFKTLVRYETKKIEFLDAFGADILVPLVQGVNFYGLIGGKKRTVDISFLEEEIMVLEEAANTLAHQLGSHILYRQQAEEESMKRMGRVAGQMAHEINNPLTALWGAAQLLDGRSEQEKENVGIIREEIKRLKNILEQWRVFSDRIIIEKSKVRINKLLKDTVKM